MQSSSKVWQDNSSNKVFLMSMASVFLCMFRPDLDNAVIRIEKSGKRNVFDISKLFAAGFWVVQVRRGSLSGCILKCVTVPLKLIETID